MQIRSPGKNFDPRGHKSMDAAYMHTRHWFLWFPCLWHAKDEYLFFFFISFFGEAQLSARPCIEAHTGLRVAHSAATHYWTSGLDCWPHPQYSYTHIIFLGSRRRSLRQVTPCCVAKRVGSRCLSAPTKMTLHQRRNSVKQRQLRSTCNSCVVRLFICSPIAR